MPAAIHTLVRLSSGASSLPSVALPQRHVRAKALEAMVSLLSMILASGVTEKMAGGILELARSLSLSLYHGGSETETKTDIQTHSP